MIKVNNGERRPVSFTGSRGGYVGPAAIEEIEDGRFHVCFTARRAELHGVRQGTIGDDAVRVVAIGGSPNVDGMVVLIVEPVS